MGATIVIGITGLIGSGKSYVCHLFAELGAVVQDSDKIVHQLIEYELREILIAKFGTNDRRELAEIVYNDESKLGELEQIIHPEVRNKNLEFIASNEGNIVVLEIPLLFETNAQEICSHIIFVNVSRETLQKRALMRSNMTPKKLEKILAEQTKISEKKEMADFVIDNEEDSDTLAQVKDILDKICAK